MLCLSACKTENKITESQFIDATESDQFELDKEVLLDDVNYMIDSRWEMEDTDSSGDEYRITDTIILHLWYEEPLRGVSAEDTLMNDTHFFSTTVNNIIITDEEFEFYSEKARREEHYSTVSFGQYEYKYYDSCVSFIRNEKVFHVSICGESIEQELCHGIIEDVFSSITLK